MKFIIMILDVIVILITGGIGISIYNFVKKNEDKKMEDIKSKLMRKINILQVMTIITIVLSIATVIVNIMDGEKKIRENTDIDKYEKYLSIYIEDTDVHSNLEIFPKKIDKEKVLEFAELNRGGLFDGSYCFYLKNQYDEEEFNNERNRINKLEIKDTVIRENLEILVTKSDGMGTYEYVIFDMENKQVVYIFNQLFSFNEININQNYVLE